MCSSEFIVAKSGRTARCLSLLVLFATGSAWAQRLRTLRRLRQGVLQFSAMTYDEEQRYLSNPDCRNRTH